MKILLDTHIYIWWLENDKKLKKRVDHLIKDAKIVYVSMISLWEIAIKINRGTLKGNIQNMITNIEPSGFNILSLKFEHIAQLEKLPLHHRDPFDRMLIAQATSEPLQFLTADNTLNHYSELVIAI